MGAPGVGAPGVGALGGALLRASRENLKGLEMEPTAREWFTAP